MEIRNSMVENEKVVSQNKKLITLQLIINAKAFFSMVSSIKFKEICDWNMNSHRIDDVDKLQKMKSFSLLWIFPLKHKTDKFNAMWQKRL